MKIHAYLNQIFDEAFFQDSGDRSLTANIRNIRNPFKAMRATFAL